MNPGFQMDNEGSVCSMQDSVSDEDEMTVGDIKSFMGDSILADAGSESVWERDIRCLREKGEWKHMKVDRIDDDMEHAHVTQALFG